MPEHKMQHYVPQFYLKNFSNEDGHTINLYHIKSGKLIFDASPRHQCVEPYFYGTDPVVEKGFGDIEGKAAALIREMLDELRLPPVRSEDAVLMLVFVLALRNRTARSAEEVKFFTDMTAKAMLRGHPQAKELDPEKWRQEPEIPVGMALQRCGMIWPVGLDLESKLIRNESNEPFITSDHPVVFYNQYMEGFTDLSYTGLACKGLQVFLPISPTAMFHMYDPWVYSFDNGRSDVCTVHDDAEALKLNELQWLSALEHVYFSGGAQSSFIEAQASHSIASRQTDPFEFRQSEWEHSSEGPSSFIMFRSQDLNIRLRPSFVRLTTRARRVPKWQRKLEARDPVLTDKILAFQEEVDKGNYGAGDILDYLAAIDH